MNGVVQIHRNQEETPMAWSSPLLNLSGASHKCFVSHLFDVLPRMRMSVLGRNRELQLPVSLLFFRDGWLVVKNRRRVPITDLVRSGMDFRYFS